MNNKRFVFETVEIIEPDNSERISDVITDKEECFSYEDLPELIPILNELDAKLKSLEKSCQKLKKECIFEFRRAERLKKEKEELQISVRLYDDDVTGLIEENEQLRDELEELRIINESLGGL